MNDLVAWYRAQLDEDERVARAAAEEGAQWSPGGGSACAGIWAEDGPDPGFPVVYDEGRPLREQATHIARNDPARVLREVAAKRAIVDEYEHKAESLARYPGQGNAGGLFSLTVAVQHLASVYSDRDGYREEWAP